MKQHYNHFDKVTIQEVWLSQPKLELTTYLIKVMTKSKPRKKTCLQSTCFLMAPTQAVLWFIHLLN